MLSQTQNKILSPRHIIEQLSVQTGQRIADFGSGAGDFAIAAAKAVGDEGLIYAFDILSTAHQSLRSKARMYGIHNIESVITNIELSQGTHLPSAHLDLVMLHNILFQISDKQAVLQEAARVLGSQGRISILEWDPLSPIGPLKEHRITPNVLHTLMQQAGFTKECDLSAGKYHYGAIYYR